MIIEKGMLVEVGEGFLDAGFYGLSVGDIGVVLSVKRRDVTVRFFQDNDPSPWVLEAATFWDMVNPVNTEEQDNG